MGDDIRRQAFLLVREELRDYEEIYRTLLGIEDALDEFLWRQARRDSGDDADYREFRSGKWLSSSTWPGPGWLVTCLRRLPQGWNARRKKLALSAYSRRSYNRHR